MTKRGRPLRSALSFIGERFGLANLELLAVHDVVLTLLNLLYTHTVDVVDRTVGDYSFFNRQIQLLNPLY